MVRNDTALLPLPMFHCPPGASPRADGRRCLAGTFLVRRGFGFRCLQWEVAGLEPHGNPFHEPALLLRHCWGDEVHKCKQRLRWDA